MDVNDPPRRLAMAGQGVAALGAVLVLSWPVAAWWSPTLLANVLPPGVALAGGNFGLLLAVSLLPALLFLGAMVEAFRLFGLVGRGLAFTEAMPRSLERLGLWAIGCAFAGFVTPTLMGLIATAGAADGSRQLIVRFGSGEIAGLVMALLLLAFGRVMREALRLARENREFV
jgi:hypothetical protein